MSNMGNLLAEGTGKGTKSIFMWAGILALMAVICFVLANTLGYTTIFGISVRNSSWGIFIFLGIISLAMIPLVGHAISKTRIKIYENGVTGTGISKWFYWGDIRTFEFILALDQVSVDLNGEQIVVHGPGTNYKVYVSNGPEIQQTIYQLKNKT